MSAHIPVGCVDGCVLGSDRRESVWAHTADHRAVGLQLSGFKVLWVFPKTRDDFLKRLVLSTSQRSSSSNRHRGRKKPDKYSLNKLESENLRLSAVKVAAPPVSLRHRLTQQQGVCQHSLLSIWIICIRSLCVPCVKSWHCTNSDNNPPAVVIFEVFKPILNDTCALLVYVVLSIRVCLNDMPWCVSPVSSFFIYIGGNHSVLMYLNIYPWSRRSPGWRSHGVWRRSLAVWRQLLLLKASFSVLF